MREAELVTPVPTAHRDEVQLRGDDAAADRRRDLIPVVGKQSKQTLFDIFGHYIEGYMTPFDTIWSVK